MSLVFLVVLPFIGSLIAAFLPSNARNAESTVAGAFTLVGLVQVAILFPGVSGGGVLRQRVAWLPDLGLDFVIRVDGFAWLFAVLVMGIGALVVLYARYYMSPADPVPRFFSFLLAFMGSMMGVVLSGNLVQIVFFWELTSLFSFLLIGYWHHRQDARRGARMALIVTSTGGLCLLAGVLVIGRIVGSYELDAVLNSGSVIRADPLYRPALVLVLLGALTKSAQFPFHFWLPHAMAAPTPVSAYLHSATMVKAGVFLMARLWPVLAGTDEWFWLVGGAGACTLLLGSYAAMFHNDLKGLLAYSTIGHLGLITLLLGMNSPMAAVAAVFHIMNHATFKASLFMAAGIIDHESGTRDIGRLSGLFKVMPITGTLAMVASAAMAGVPLLNGFLSKEMFFAQAVYLSAAPWVEIALPLIATIAGMFSVAYALRFTVDVFFGPRATDLPRIPHEPSRLMRVPVDLLVLACLVVGIFPEQSVRAFLDAAAAPVVGGVLPRYSLAVWHGLNAPMLMSASAMVGGIALYVLLRKRLKAGRFARPPLIHLLDGRRIFQGSLVGLSWAGRRALRRVGTERLQVQVLCLVGLAFVAGLAPFREVPLAPAGQPLLPMSIEFVGLWAIGMACAIGAAWQAKYHRLAALILAGGAGLITCVTFVWFSAPDLALTQLTVEIVTTVLMLLGLRWLPKRVESADDLRRRSLRARARRIRDFIIAVFIGTGLAAVTYAVLTRGFPQSISPFFLSRALPEGGGTNVVNVMLVDFRGFDTLGEVTVLSAVSLTIYALLRRFRPAAESIEQPPQQRGFNPDVVTDLVNPRAAQDTAVGYLLVPAVLVRLVLPISWIVGIHLLLRGHNQPGGGFIAGLVVSIGFLLQYMVAGTLWVEAHMRLRPPRWIAAGQLIAVATGLGALVVGFPFLTSHTAHLSLPVFGEVHLPSAMFFDFGIFSVVVGATMLILTAIAHQSLRSRRSDPRAPQAKGDGPDDPDPRAVAVVAEGVA